MRDWLALPDFGTLASEHVFAAGAITVTLVQCVIVACVSWLARWRRARVFPPDDPRRIWAEFKELRAECASSTTRLEAAVARLKDRTTAHLREHGRRAQELQASQDKVDQAASLNEALGRQIADLELVKARHVLELERRDEELSSRADALASAEQTIALLQGMLDVADRARPRVASHAAS